MCVLLAFVRASLIGPHSYYLWSLHDTIMPSCGSVPWPWNMSIILHGPLKQIGNVHLLFIHSSWASKFGWSFAPNTMHSNYCPYQEHSHKFIVHPNIAPLKLLLIKALSLKLLTLFTIFLLLKPAHIIICIGVDFFLLSKFLPMKVR
jgi:hypothetical protein